MIRPPFLARVAAGVAVTAYEETLKLPSTAVALPMTTVSQILQTTMRLQQVMTSLAIKGDQFFEVIGAAPAETADWATFDEDVSDSPGAPAVAPRTDSPTPPAPENHDATTSVPGRFALYSIPPATETEAPGGSETTNNSSAAARTAPATKAAAKKTAAKKAAKKTTPVVKTPEIAEYLDYDSLTLAQLRARLRTLSVEELTALLDYENAHSARPPFVTMLSNRITSARDK